MPSKMPTTEWAATVKQNLTNRLQHARTRLQSYRTSRFSSGWITQVRDNHLFITLTVHDGGSIGDRYHIEVSDGIRLMMADATLVQSGETTGVFKLNGEVSISSANENRRMTIRCPGSLEVDGRSHEIAIVDISDDGLGILSDAKLERGQTAKIEAVLGSKAMEIEGKALYCKPLQRSRWAYRIGLHVPGLSLLIDPFERDLGKARRQA